MKIILSRKGFDASSGGVASPILPDGALVPLPIPSPDSPLTYAKLRLGSQPLDSLVEDLTSRQVRAGDGAHLDPDLSASTYGRLAGWRPLFGQAGAAQAHLMNQGVDVGDLFLFFGWFRQTQRTESGYGFVTGAPDLHVLWGWLQIDTVLPVDQPVSDVPPWVAYHPHFSGVSWPTNTVYVARDHLRLPGMPPGSPGAGAFPRYRDRLCLTAPGHTRRWWRLPRWFFPGNQRPPLTYHGNLNRWTMTRDHVILESMSPGQEFVLDTQHYPETIEWAYDLISGAAWPSLRPESLERDRGSQGPPRP